MPRPGRLDALISQAALAGLERERQRIDRQVAQVRGLLGRAAQPVTAVREKRALNPASRKRISVAQRKRWAEFRKRWRKRAATRAARRPLRRAVPIMALVQKAASR